MATLADNNNTTTTADVVGADGADGATEAGPLRNLLATERAKTAMASTADFLQSDRARSATTFLAEIYGRAAGALPTSAQDRLSALEGSVAQRITTENVESFIDSLDSALTRLNERATTVVAKTKELPGAFKNRAQEGAARAVGNIDTTVATQITRLEGLLDTLLPEENTDVDGGDDDAVVAEEAVVAADEKQNKAIPRVVELSSRISKRLRRRAMKNLSALRERVDEVQHIDLIAYAADYLDKDEKEIRQRVHDARDAVTSRTAPLVNRVTVTVTGARQLMDANRAVVVQRVRSFYAVLVVEYLGLVEKGACARSDSVAFVNRVKESLGAAWSERLAAPTAAYFTYIAGEWAKTAEDDVEGTTTENENKKDDDDAANTDADDDTMGGEESKSNTDKINAATRRVAAKAQRRLRHVDRFLRAVTPQINAALGEAVSAVIGNVRNLTIQRLSGGDLVTEVKEFDDDEAAMAPAVAEVEKEATATASPAAAPVQEEDEVVGDAEEGEEEVLKQADTEDDEVVGDAEEGEEEVLKQADTEDDEDL